MSTIHGFRYLAPPRRRDSKCRRMEIAIWVTWVVLTSASCIFCGYLVKKCTNTYFKFAKREYLLKKFVKHYLNCRQYTQCPARTLISWRMGENINFSL